MKGTVIVFAVIMCSFFTCIVRAEAKGALPADAAALLEMEGQSYYLAHNLHGDKARRKVYSVNYQLSGGGNPLGFGNSDHQDSTKSFIIQRCGN
jgi:hypothetical protein